MKYSRFFLNRLLHILRAHSNSKFIPLSEEFNKDIIWFKNFVEKFNGVTFFEKTNFDHEMCLDASLTGIGGFCANEIYHGRIPQHYATANIATLEMHNVLVAIRLWAEKCKHCTVLFRCDNEAVVTVLNSGKPKDPDLGAIS